MWTLFRPGGIALSNSSVLFLTTYISLHGVPGSYCPDVNRQPGSSFRLCLLEWMFPEIDPDTDWSVVDRSKITDASCLASSAVALSIRDAQTMITQELPFEDSARVNDRWLDVQWCLRAMSFDISVSSPTTASQTKRRAVVATPSVLQHVARRVLELLHRDISYHLENSSPEVCPRILFWFYSVFYFKFRCRHFVDHHKCILPKYTTSFLVFRDVNLWIGFKGWAQRSISVLPAVLPDLDKFLICSAL